ncbi:hypothetical protein [Pedococcus sp.]|jgi:uncharacterized membrane protein|uniref:hypothetical protein n=1 Tax=Pedococcus sp. TaxID=2860345 RepID=UPI002E10FFB5|nr:hypothetical protein [Pedococcus sp.]
MWDWGYMGPDGLMIVLVPIMVIGLVVVLVLGINALYPSDKGSKPRAEAQSEPPRTRAEEELELRYARGEIDEDTLARQRAVLRQR